MSRMPRDAYPGYSDDTANRPKRKRTNQQATIDALVAALEDCRAFFNDLKRDEADVDEFLEIIDAALALARKGG